MNKAGAEAPACEDLGGGSDRLEQLATQYAGKAKDSGTKQQDAAGLRSGHAAAADCESFRRNRAYGTLGGYRRAACATAALSAILIPEYGVAAGHNRVLQVEPVGCAASGSYIQARHRDLVNVVVILVGGNELVSDVFATGRTGAKHRSPVLRGSNGPVHRGH